jgi:hypothetical protein
MDGKMKYIFQSYEIITLGQTYDSFIYYQYLLLSTKLDN